MNLDVMIILTDFTWTLQSPCFVALIMGGWQGEFLLREANYIFICYVFTFIFKISALCKMTGINGAQEHAEGILRVTRPLCESQNKRVNENRS